MELWKKREKHHTEVHSVLMENGCLNAKGHLVRWNGPKIIPLLNQLGHSDLSYHRCSCSKEG